MSKVTVLEMELVREIKGMCEYKVTYMDETVICTRVESKFSPTFNWSAELPMEVMGFVEGWIEEEY